MQTSQFDAKLGIIRSTFTGAMTPDDQQAYVARWEAAKDAALESTGRVAHFVDASDAVIQTRFGMDRLQIYQKDPLPYSGRTAILVKAQSAHKNLTLQNGKNNEIRFFSDENEALKWLRGDAH